MEIGGGRVSAQRGMQKQPPGAAGILTDEGNDISNTCQILEIL